MPWGVTPPYFARISFSMEPEFTPMRTGMRCCFRQSASARTLASPPMLPGLMRTLAMPFSMERMASLWSKWMSATSGTGDASTSARTASAQASS